MKNEQIQEIEILKKYNQNHIVEHMEKINNEDREKIAKQIEEIDFEEITSFVFSPPMRAVSSSLTILTICCEGTRLSRTSAPTALSEQVLMKSLTTL